MLIECSEMTVNYTVIHCNTLHYTVEYTKTNCSSGNKTKPYHSKCDCYKNTRRSVTETSWRYCYSLKLHHYRKRWLSRNGCIGLVENIRETSVNKYKTWRFKVKLCECYIYLWLVGNNALNDNRKLWKIVWMCQNII